jgi:hypothetical protein
MKDSVMDLIEISLNKGDALRQKIARMIRNYKLPNEIRILLVTCYFDIIFEHHQAIILLIKHRLYGSAFSLFRSVYEALHRALWIKECACNQQVEEIMKNDRRSVFPPMEQMLIHIDEAYNAGQFFQNIGNKKAWKSMNSYTHSGLLQLQRRYVNGMIKPNYNEGEILEVLNFTNWMLLFGARLFFVAASNDAEAEEVNMMMLNYRGLWPSTIK